MVYFGARGCMLRFMKNSGKPVDSEKERFIALARRLTASSSPAERQRIKKQLARMTFGE